jgi:phosphatidylglycerophosphate synthase
MDTNEPQVEAKLRSDCYSAGERAWMEHGQGLRAYCLNPLLGALHRCRVTPDAVTIASGLCGATFLPLWLAHNSLAALICLLLHVLLDGLDGPLARHQGTASPRGSFVDTFTDQVVVTLVTVAWLIRSPSSLNIAFGGGYIFLYAMVVGMAMVRNALDVPYSWLVRPRFIVFVAIAVEWLSEWPLTLGALIVCDLLLTIKCASGFVALRAKLPGPNESV